MCVGGVGGSSKHTAAFFLDDHAAGLAGADVVLVATKRDANGTVAKMLRLHAPRSCTILLCQNGLDAAADFECGPDQAVFQCIVTFNVVRHQ